MFSIFNIADKKPPQIKSIKKDNHGKRAFMLKLYFSCTEIQPIPNYLQPSAHSKQCYCWFLLYTLRLSKGKTKMKDQTKVIQTEYIIVTLYLCFLCSDHVPRVDESVTPAPDVRKHFQCSVLCAIPKMTWPFWSALLYQHFTSAKLLLTKHSWERSLVAFAKFPFS